jgi:hypothetical protein
MKKDVSGGGEVQVHKIRKNDEKRRFRRSKVKVQKSEKMKKDVLGGGKVKVHKIRKNEKRRFRRWRGSSS